MCTEKYHQGWSARVKIEKIYVISTVSASTFILLATPNVEK